MLSRGALRASFLATLLVCCPCGKRASVTLQDIIHGGVRRRVCIVLLPCGRLAMGETKKVNHCPQFWVFLPMWYSFSAKKLKRRIVTIYRWATVPPPLKTRTTEECMGTRCPSESARAFSQRRERLCLPREHAPVFSCARKKMPPLLTYNHWRGTVSEIGLGPPPIPRDPSLSNRRKWVRS